MSPRRRIAVATIVIMAATVVPWTAPTPAPPAAEARSIPLVLAAVGPQAWETDAIPADAAIVGLSWEGQTPPGEAWVRSSPDGRTWTPWVELHVEADEGPDPGTVEHGQKRDASAPAYIGSDRFVQYRVASVNPGQLRAELVGEKGAPGGGLLQRLQLPWRKAPAGPRADASPDQPGGIVTREQWGAESCVGPTTDDPPVYVKRVRVMFVHHTATTNAYSSDEAAAIVRNICLYHVNAQGWNDIGYNFLIDKFGTVYEGRGGGVDRGVLGAHTGGFNSYSTGVAFIGTHETTAPTPQARAAFLELATWKLDLHHVDPIGRSTVRSLGSSRHEQGKMVDLANVSGHRDASLTACPGEACYGLLGGFRTAIDQGGGAKIYGGWPDPDPIPGSPQEGYDPATFRMRFTVPTDWALRVLNDGGSVVFQAAGSGTTASVPWDGTSGGKPLPVGSYQVQVDGTTAQGTPRPVRDRFQLGGYIPPFRDDDGSFHELDILALFDSGITKGCSADGTLFCPKDPVTRWEMATFLVRALGLSTEENPDAFSDDDGHEFEPFIDALAAAGVTNGCGGSGFCPERSVNRAEMAAFLLRSIEHGEESHLPAYQGLFPDVSSSSWYGRLVEHLKDHEITTGYPDGTYRPDLPVSREQMASFLVRTFLK